MEVSGNHNVWYAVVNIFAASKRAGNMWYTVEKALKADNVPYVGVKTGRDGNAMTLTCAACAEGYRKFIAVGGDGTVHDVLEGIMVFIEGHSVAGRDISLSDFTLAVIPVGSGNDWIKTTGVPHDLMKASALFTEGTVRRQDIVKASLLDPNSLPEERVLKISYMANVGGVGLDARVCDKVNREKKRGKRGKILYVSALVYHIIHRIPAFAKIVCDGKQVFDGPFFSIAFGIGKYSGGGMRQTPEAVMDDGLLDMTIIPELPLMKIAQEAPKLFTDKFWTVKELVTARSRCITVIPYDPAQTGKASFGELVEVDGEVVGNAPVKFEILPSQLNILTV